MGRLIPAGTGLGAYKRLSVHVEDGGADELPAAAMAGLAAPGPAGHPAGRIARQEPAESLLKSPLPAGRGRALFFLGLRDGQRPQPARRRATPLASPWAAGTSPVVSRLRDGVALPERRDVLEDAGVVRHAAAEHDRARVDDVDHHRQRSGQPVLVAGEGRSAAGPRPAARRAISVPATLVRPSPAPVSRRQASPRGERFDAARRGRRSRRGCRLARAQEGQGGVAPFRGAPFSPVSTRPSTTSPPPTPVPSVAPKTTSGRPRSERRCGGAAAPSIASESTKHLPSLARRTGRPSAAASSRSSGRPFRQARFAFGSRPASGAAPRACPRPTVAGPRRPAFQSLHQVADRVQHVVVCGGVGTRWRARSAAVLGQRQALDLRATHVDADAHGVVDNTAVGCPARPGPGAILRAHLVLPLPRSSYRARPVHPRLARPASWSSACGPAAVARRRGAAADDAVPLHRRQARADRDLDRGRRTGTFMSTVGLTQAVSVRGIGNRPGAIQMNSGYRWPYGRREGVLPIWAHRRAAAPGAGSSRASSSRTAPRDTLRGPARTRPPTTTSASSFSGDSTQGDGARRDHLRRAASTATRGAYMTAGRRRPPATASRSRSPAVPTACGR